MDIECDLMVKNTPRPMFLAWNFTLLPKSFENGKISLQDSFFLKKKSSKE
jgi:hypothetical protein